MASSTFEVTETENETGKELAFGLEACEENGLLTAQVDSEISKDHNYTKDPDESEEDVEKNELESQPETEKASSKSPRVARGVKKLNSKAVKGKKSASLKKEQISKRGRPKTEVLAEDSNKAEDNSLTENKNSIEELPKPQKRGRKRKVEEKENVIDRSIVEEVQNIKGEDSTPEVNNSTPEKKTKATPKKTPVIKSKSTLSVAGGSTNNKLPTGWIRKEVTRKSGKSAGKIDVYYYSPDGIKCRSRPDIASYIARTKAKLKVEDFNFGRIKAPEEVQSKNTAKKAKLLVSKSKSTASKKKAQSSPPSKRRKNLLVKLSVSPKKSSYKKTKATPKNQSKISVKTVKTSGSRGGKKKKSP